MGRTLVCIVLVAFALLLSGCHSSSGSAGETNGEGGIDISLADLLGERRGGLAVVAEEGATKIHIHDEAQQEGKLPYFLMPDFRLPLVLPVLCRDKFHATL